MEDGMNEAQRAAIHESLRDNLGVETASQVARRQRCLRKGHDLTVEENVYTRPDGRRRCRLCQIEGQRDRRRRQRSEL
jgi:hypothetical protein